MEQAKCKSEGVYGARSMWSVGQLRLASQAVQTLFARHARNVARVEAAGRSFAVRCALAAKRIAALRLRVVVE
jgi:hypothetical protein